MIIIDRNSIDSTHLPSLSSSHDLAYLALISGSVSIVGMANLRHSRE